ncbi:LysE family transporter [Glutamicibacter creatinolyticus]|uniref:LysE family transporter n=1 Tax=Micrococcaceae TaxID=1268 RepID=UPI0006D0F2F0|nr:LysE family transporter [Arthrobacter sp. JCM 19049]
MTLPLWFSLLGAAVVISFTPGAGAINTMSNSIRVGWRRSLWGIIGQQLALLIHVAIVAAGVGLLVSRSPVLFEVIRYAGAGYLVYLGVRMLLARPQPEQLQDAAPAGRLYMVRQGLLVNLLNPKAIVFFLALTPQFIRPDAPQLPQYLVFMATIVLVDVLVMFLFFAAMARTFQRFTATVRGARIQNIVFGTLFIFVAVLLVLAR